MKKIYYTSDFLGKALFILSIFMALVMASLIISKPFLSIDEWFTKGIVQLSASQIIGITAADVHPPLYYLILKIPMNILAFLKIRYNLVFLIKFMSVLPFIILLLISVTKIRKEYGWFSCGLFSLSLACMADFFVVFLTARMYGWSILFLVLAFLCVGDIIKCSNYKSWILLSVFSVLGAYTHYFTAISAVVLYFILLANIMFNRKLGLGRSDMKKWLMSTVMGIVLYVPWIFTLFEQLSNVHESYWIPAVGLRSILDCVSLVFSSSPNAYLNVVLAILFLAIFILIIRKSLSNNSHNNDYVLMAVSIFVITLIVGIAVSLTFKPVLLKRYLIPSIAVAWLGISIFVADFDFKKYVVPVVVIFLMFSAFNVMTETSVIDNEYERTTTTYHALNDINNTDSIVVFAGMQNCIRFDNELGNMTKYYRFHLDNHTYGSGSYNELVNTDKHNFEIPEDMDRENNVVIIGNANINRVSSPDLKINKFYEDYGYFYRVTCSSTHD